MKIPQPARNRFLYVSLILCSLQACTLVPGVRKNEDIKASKRDKFHELNTGVLNKLKSGDKGGLRPLLSDDEAKKDITKLVDSISQKLREGDYALMDEYYVINKYADSDTIKYTGGEVNRYGLKYPYVTFEEYFAYFLPKQGDNKYMIGLIYGNFKEGWRLIDISMAPYSIDGKTGPEHYQIARDNYSKMYPIGAAVEAAKAEECMKPAPYWEYPDKADAQSFFKRSRDFMSYVRLPFIVPVSTGPMVVALGDKYTPDGAYPLVTYLTHFDINNPDRVRKENEAVNKTVCMLFRGLSKHYDYIYYSAYNQMPGKDPKIPHLDMKVKPVDMPFVVLHQ